MHTCPRVFGNQPRHRPGDFIARIIVRTSHGGVGVKFLMQSFTFMTIPAMQVPTALAYLYLRRHSPGAG